MVVPKANPKANKVAANANPKGIIGREVSRVALHINLDVFHPKESCEQQHPPQESCRKWLDRLYHLKPLHQEDHRNSDATVAKASVTVF